jgi:hypothetical protein
MLFQQPFLDGIRTGTITLAFRRWRRPSVKAGGTLLTAVGQLHIDSVEPITPGQISEDDARRAGYASRQDLLIELSQRSEGDLYRIALGALEADPRIALRERPATDSEQSQLLRRLHSLDTKAPGGPWTMRTLEVIRARPGVRAADLCASLDQEKDAFKINVRKLKNLGLTESLETGYRLSPRGEALLRGKDCSTPD